MKVRVNSRPISGEVCIPPSKSYAHRILLCSAFSNAETVIENLVLNKDIEATMGVLVEIGAKITNLGENRYKVTPIDREKVRGKEVTLNANESGSTLRFLLPIISALGLNAKVDGKPGLRARPIKLLLDVLRLHGAKIDGDALPVNLSGEISSGVYEIDATQSSQNITGLLFGLSLLNAESEIIFVGKAVSLGYLDITLEVFEQFGVKIEKTEKGYKIKPQKFITPSKISVEGDYSSAGFHIALGALCGDMVLKGLKQNSKQGDRAMIDVVQSMGGKVSFVGDDLVLKKSQLESANINGVDIPDLLPIISVCCAFAKGESKITGVDRLKIKESDRLQAIMDTLSHFGVEFRYENDTLFIKGIEERQAKDCEICGYNDHRIVMSAVVMAIAFGGAHTVTDANAIEKSYPAFFEDVKRIGGEEIVELF